MSLRDWLNNGWLRPHKGTKEDIQNLFEIVDRDIADAESGISPDWKFGIAYNAALKLCTILLYAEGYRPEKNLQHYRKMKGKMHKLKFELQRRGLPVGVQASACPIF